MKAFPVFFSFFIIRISFLNHAHSIFNLKLSEFFFHNWFHCFSPKSRGSCKTAVFSMCVLPSIHNSASLPVFLPVSAKYFSLNKISLILPGVDLARMIPSYSVILCENLSEVVVFDQVQLKCSQIVRLEDPLISNILKNDWYG